MFGLTFEYQTDENDVYTRVMCKCIYSRTCRYLTRMAILKFEKLQQKKAGVGPKLLRAAKSGAAAFPHLLGIVKQLNMNEVMDTAEYLQLKMPNEDVRTLEGLGLLLHFTKKVNLH